MKFRDNLLHLRQQRNMTQEQLAMLLGVSRQSVAKWEGGQSTPEVDKLVKMSELFGGTAAVQEGVEHADAAVKFFWVVWPIGGIGCAIATLAMRAAAGR